MVSGFKEIQHTADWALEVWAPDFPGLLVQAALGMNWLMGLNLTGHPIVERLVTLTAVDDESIMVAFLNNILYEIEMDNIGFASFDANWDDKSMLIRMTGSPITHAQGEIKGVTFHNLKILRSEKGLSATIVFDV